MRHSVQRRADEAGQTVGSPDASSGRGARKSIGITVFSGMIASTCLAVLFVPSLFVIVLEERRAARRHQVAAPSQQ
jgi:hypothetical protein